jgi:Ala-tRNA(Pro) deacylase
MRLQAYLERMEIPFETHSHEAAWTAQQLAQMEHVSGHRVIKPVLVEADGELLLCALPASMRIDLNALRAELGCEEMHLADEQTLRDVFDDCELGAEPPIGAIFGLPTVMDESLFRQDKVMFQSGSHLQSVSLSLSDYRRIAQPGVAHFSRPM